MVTVVSFFIAVLVPLIILSAIALGLMLLFLLLQRGIDELRYRRRQTLIARYRETINALLSPDATNADVYRVARIPARHRPVVEAMILTPLALSTGSVVERLREAARVTGLIAQWAGQLSNRRWWVRADSVRALGLVREHRALPLLVAALDDDHEEVRAAAVEALGFIGDPASIPVLLSRLPDQSRNQRARIIEALHEFGDTATPALVEHARVHINDAVVVADVLGLIGGHVAAEELKSWMVMPRADVRTAALRALGSIGLDQDGAIVALQALDDPDPGVRAMAARALGRAGRQGAAAHLARHLDDEWVVAANCADALRKMGGIGLDLLHVRSIEDGYVGDLARQMLWERGAAEGAS